MLTGYFHLIKLYHTDLASLVRASERLKFRNLEKVHTALSFLTLAWPLLSPSIAQDLREQSRRLSQTSTAPNTSIP